MPEENSRTAVLVVSDDPHVHEEARYGFSDDVLVQSAGDAREAMRMMVEGVPDAVVIDIQTGSAGGFSLCREMSQDPWLRDLPILMLLEREQDAWLARQAGAHRHVTKPLDAADLVAEVEALLPQTSKS